MCILAKERDEILPVKFITVCKSGIFILPISPYSLKKKVFLYFAGCRAVERKVIHTFVGGPFVLSPM